MSHFALLWKARAIERYRRNYEREKYLSLEPEDLPKNLIQRLRRCRYSFKKKLRKFFINIFPKPILNFFFYIKTDQTFPNFIVKSIVGFLGGSVLTYVLFMFLVFQLSISLVHATVMCSVIGVLLTLGLAFSYRVRCLVFLLFPQFFSEVGRYTLIGYALILILTGPAKNTLHNSEVLSESMACGQEQLKTNVRQIKESIVRPFYSMKETIKLMVESVKVVAEDVKKTLMSINRMVISIVNVIQSAANWLASIVTVCSKKMGSPSERCHRALEDGVLDCQARLGAYFSWLCNVAYVAKAACGAAKMLDAMCVLVDFVNSTVVATIKRKLKTFSNHVKTMLYVSVRMHHEYSFNTNSSKSASQVAAGIVTEIRHRADRFLQWFSWMSCITSLFLLIIIFRAKYYQYMYLGRMRYDNRYLTRPFRELDLRRARESRDTVLPLNRRERAEIVTTTSFRLVACERRNLARSAVFLSITTLKLLVHMAVDYSLYWVLKTVRYHGRFEAPPKLPNTDGGVIVSGAGMVAMMLRALSAALVAPLKVLPVITPVSCLPEPSPPDMERNLQICILIALVWVLLLLQPYGLRLRHVVMDHYRPERARARAVWLYNHIMRRRGGFVRLARRKLHRDLKMHSEDRYTFRQWLDSIIPCRWLRALLRTGGGEDRCVLCGVGEDPHDPDTQLIRCETPGCEGVYCVSCFEDIGRLCTACLTPADYGDISDISLERGSSEDSGKVTGMQHDIAPAEDTQSEQDTSEENDENQRLMKNKKEETRKGKSNKKADGNNPKRGAMPRLFKKRQRNNENTENEHKIYHGNIDQVMSMANANSSTEYNTDDPLLGGSRGDNKQVFWLWKNNKTYCYGGDCNESSRCDGYLNVDGSRGNSSSSTCQSSVCKSPCLSRGRRKRNRKKKKRKAGEKSAEGIDDCICKEFQDIERSRSRFRSLSDCEMRSERKCLRQNHQSRRRNNERRNTCKARYPSTDDETRPTSFKNDKRNTCKGKYSSTDDETRSRSFKNERRNTCKDKYSSTDDETRSRSFKNERRNTCKYKYSSTDDETRSRSFKNERRNTCQAKYSSTDETRSRSCLSTCKNNTSKIEEKVMKDKCENTLKDTSKLSLQPTCKSSNRKIKQKKLKDACLNTEVNMKSWKRLLSTCKSSNSKIEENKLKDACLNMDNAKKSENLLQQPYESSQRKIEQRKIKDQCVKTDDNRKSWKHVLPTRKSSRKMEERKLREACLNTDDKVLQRKRRAYCETLKHRKHKEGSCECIEDSSICSKCKNKCKGSDSSIERLKDERRDFVEKHRRLIMDPCIDTRRSFYSKLKELLCNDNITDCECPDSEPCEDLCPWIRQMQESLNRSVVRKRRKRIIHLRRRKKSEKAKMVTICPHCGAWIKNDGYCKKCKNNFSKLLTRKLRKNKFSKKFPLKATATTCKQYDENLNKAWNDAQHSKQFTNTPLKCESTTKECIQRGYKASCSSNPDYDALLRCLKESCNKKTHWKTFLCKLRTKRNIRQNRQCNKTAHIYQTIVNPAYGIDANVNEEAIKHHNQNISSLVPEKLKIGREFKVMLPKAKWNIPHRAPIHRKRPEKTDIDKDILTEIYAREMGFELADEETRYKQLIAATNKLKSLVKSNKKTKELKNVLDQVEPITPAQPVGPWVSNYEWPKMLESPKCRCPEDVCTCQAKKEGASSDDSGIIYDNLPKLPIKPAQMVQPKWSISNISKYLKRMIKGRKKDEVNLLAGEGSVIPMLDRAVAVETEKYKDADQLSIDCVARCHKYYDPPEDNDEDNYVERLKEIQKWEDAKRRKKLILLRRKLTDKLDNDRCCNRGRSVLDEASIQDLLNELCGPPDTKGYGSTQTCVQAEDDVGDDVKINMEPVCSKVTCKNKCAVKLKKELYFGDEAAPAPVVGREIKTLDGAKINMELLRCGTHCRREPEEDPRGVEQLKCISFNSPKCSDGVLNRVKNCTSKVLGLGRTQTVAGSTQTIAGWAQTIDGRTETIARKEVSAKMDQDDNNSLRNEIYGCHYLDEDEQYKEFLRHDDLNCLNAEVNCTKSPWSKEPQVWMGYEASAFRTPRELNQSADKSTYCRPKTRHHRYNSPTHHRDDSPRHRQGESPRRHVYDSPANHRYDSPRNHRNDSPRHDRDDTQRHQQRDSPRYHTDSPKHRRYDSPRNHPDDSAKRQHRGHSPRQQHGCEESSKPCTYGTDKGTQADYTNIKKNESAKAHRYLLESEKYRRRKPESGERGTEPATDRGGGPDRQIDKLEEEFLEKYGCKREFDIKRRELQEKKKREGSGNWQDEMKEQFRKQERYRQLYEEYKKKTYLKKKGYVTESKDPSRITNNGDQRHRARERRNRGPENSYGLAFRCDSPSARCKDCDARRGANVDNIMKLNENERAFCMYHARVNPNLTRVKHRRIVLKDEATGAFDRDKMQNIDVSLSTRLKVPADFDASFFDRKLVSSRAKQHGAHSATSSHMEKYEGVLSSRSDFHEFEPKKTSSPEEKTRFRNHEAITNDASPIHPSFNCGFFEMFHEPLPKDDAGNLMKEDLGIHISSEMAILERSMTESQQREETRRSVSQSTADVRSGETTSSGPGRRAGKKSIYTYIKTKFTKAGKSTHAPGGSGRKVE